MRYCALRLQCFMHLRYLHGGYAGTSGSIKLASEIPNNQSATPLLLSRVKSILVRASHQNTQMIVRTASLMLACNTTMLCLSCSAINRAEMHIGISF